MTDKRDPVAPGVASYETAAGERAPVYVVALRGDAPDRLTDLATVTNDLELVIECCERVLAHRDDDPIQARAMWDSALVAYRRCFGQRGELLVRGGHDPELSSAVLDGAEQATHDRALALASELATRTAGELPSDGTTPRLLLTLGSPTDRRVLGVLVPSARQLPGTDEATSLRQAALTLRGFTDARRVDLTRAIVADADSRLDDLYVDAVPYTTGAD